MRRLLFVAVLAAVAGVTAGCSGDDPPEATGAASTSTSTKAPPPTTTTTTTSSGKSFGRLESGVVARVNDGDTITLRDGRRIRLVQIDAPELTDECWGREAKREAEKLMPPGTTVTLQRDPALDDADKFGRLLRYVEANALNMNAELVVFGAAVPYFFRGERGRYATDLMIAVKEARAKRLGMWKACPRARLNTGVGSLTGPA